MTNVGDRIELICINDPLTQLKPGALGTVSRIDDLGTVHVAWDSGSTLGLLVDQGDQFRVIAPVVKIDSAE